jgi:monofunctional biosynthetic peptidoglycan transglycosylase
VVISVMVSEDARCCEHHGVEGGALKEVLDNRDGPLRGASRGGMRTVRILVLWRSPGDVREGLGVPIALYADAIWSKRRAMEIYLNIAEWGSGIFGIEAAARHYFGRAAKDLSANQSALLAVTLPNPKVRNPAKPSRLMQSLARTVAARARIAGPYIKCLYP